MRRKGFSKPRSKSNRSLPATELPGGGELPKLTVALRHGEDGYIVAECIDLPGCMSQGKTEEEVRKNIVDAIQSCLAVRIKELLRESRTFPPNLIGIEAQETFQVRPPELELVAAD